MKTKQRNTKLKSFKRERLIIDLAKQQCHQDGECEVEEAGVVSEGRDNGAYVQAWVWVDFTDTDLDKNSKRHFLNR